MLGHRVPRPVRVSTTLFSDPPGRPDAMMEVRVELGTPYFFKEPLNANLRRRQV